MRGLASNVERKMFGEVVEGLVQEELPVGLKVSFRSASEVGAIAFRE